MLLLAVGCGGDPDDGGQGGNGKSGQDTAGTPEALTEFYQQQVEWEDCEGKFECATYEVPLDYDEPDGETLDIAVKRLSASGDSTGSLVVNPGGPGGSGLQYVTMASDIVTEGVRERFDLVGFDPRGVGESSPVRCLPPEKLDAFLGSDVDSADGNADPADVTDKGVQQLTSSSEEFVQACQDNSGELINHLGTTNVAADVDVLRSVLGDEGLTYLGKSYGTSIGAHYADQFPDRVRAMVLDGALDPTLDQVEVARQQADGFHTSVRAFVSDCLEHSDCPLGGSDTSTDAGMDRLGELLDKAGSEPLENRNGDREVTRAWAETGVLAGMYSAERWPQLRSALGDAFDGDGTALLRFGDSMYGRHPGGNYANKTAALMAVNCSDSPSPRDPAAYRKAASEADGDAPLFGSSLVWGALPCAYWPKEAVAEEKQLDAAGAEELLVVGTTRDPATPYEWSQNLADQLEPGVLLTREGDGHTGYRMGNSCVDDAVDTYLLEGTAPEDGTVCE